jgi:hypothetical protein
MLFGLEATSNIQLHHGLHMCLLRLEATLINQIISDFLAKPQALTSIVSTGLYVTYRCHTAELCSSQSIY